MQLSRYLTFEEQLLVKDARLVPVSAALLRAAQIKMDELQAQAIEKAGTIDQHELEMLLIRAQGLKWILELPEKIKTSINSEV